MISTDNIKILDATLRDGGLVNNHYFEKSFVKALYQANVSANIDYMEFGYRADKKLYDPKKYGKWKYSSDEDIREIVGDNNTNLKLSVMVDVGRCDLKRDFHKKDLSPIDLIRVATYIDTIAEARTMIEYIANLGYDVTCNLMAISKCTDLQIINAVETMADSPIMGFYIVDSYGALLPRRVQELTEMVTDKMFCAGKQVGIHTHNNQQCALANTIASFDAGATLLDGSVYGMGRGAGNCILEGLIGSFHADRYHIEPYLDLIENQMLALKSQGIEWGYNTSYLLTGLTNNHPQFAINAAKENNYNYRNQFRMLRERCNE